jgi:small subunit ribosomal protein S15
MSLNPERKLAVVQQYAIKPGDTGSPEVQIACSPSASTA